MPAELTRMSTDPSVFTQERTIAAGTPGWVMSATMNSIRRPAPSISRRVVPSSSANPTANTSAPALASARENALPRPVLPPVTRALRPARENRSRLKSAMSIRQPPAQRRHEHGKQPGNRRGPARYRLLTIRTVANEIHPLPPRSCTGRPGSHMASAELTLVDLTAQKGTSHEGHHGWRGRGGCSSVGPDLHRGQLLLPALVDQRWHPQ